MPPLLTGAARTKNIGRSEIHKERTGEFLRESGPSKDVDYITTWITYKF
jgi:hypothetical protein